MKPKYTRISTLFRKVRDNLALTIREYHDEEKGQHICDIINDTFYPNDEISCRLKNILFEYFDDMDLRVYQSIWGTTIHNYSGIYTFKEHKAFEHNQLQRYIALSLLIEIFKDKKIRIN